MWKNRISKITKIKTCLKYKITKLTQLTVMDYNLLVQENN